MKNRKNTIKLSTFLIIGSLLFGFSANARDPMQMKASEFNRHKEACKLPITTFIMQNYTGTENDKSIYVMNRIDKLCECVMMDMLRYEDDEINNWTVEQSRKIEDPIVRKCLKKVGITKKEMEIYF